MTPLGPPTATLPATADTRQVAATPAKPDRLILDCVDRGSRASPLGREDCETRRFATPDPVEIPGKAPVDGRWIAAAKAKAAKRAPLPAETDDILWELAKRKF